MLRNIIVSNPHILILQEKRPLQTAAFFIQHCSVVSHLIYLRSTMGHRTLYLLLLLIPCSLQAQENFYAAPGSVVRIDSGALVSVIGQVENQSGSAGSFSIHRSGIFYFYGPKWIQGSNSPVTDQGKIRFIQPQPSPYSGNTAQYITGSGNGSYVNNIAVDNTQNLNLLGADLYIRDTLQFTAGHIILNRRNLILGLQNPGVITGYDSVRYVVTNHTATPDSGFLIRRSIGTSTGNTDFPVGYRTGDYTPVRISNTGNTDTFMVRVFLHAYESASSGVLKDNESVGRTWQIKDAVPGQNNVNLRLQHNINSEGAYYSPLRSRHYITRYAGYSGNNGGDTASGSRWDLVFQSNLGAGTNPGPITTGSALAGAVMSARSGFDTMGYFTKTTYSFVPLPLELADLRAEWVGRDAQISWMTLGESQIAAFEIQRSNDANVFEYAGTVNSLAPGGISHAPLKYSFTDPGRKDGNHHQHYYRLKIMESNGQVSFSPWVKLNDGAGITVRAYPNPAADWFQIETDKGIKGMGTITIFDQSGKLIGRYETGQGSLISQLDIRAFSEGIYHVQLNQAGQTWMFKLAVMR